MWTTWKVLATRHGWRGDARSLAMPSRWLAGRRAVCAAESYPRDEDSVRLVALALLTVLGEDGAPAADGLPVRAE